jgi:hypothetical protein
MSLEKLNGTLVFVQMQKPTDCYVAEKGKEWKASIVVDEETADLWDEAYPKQSAKAVKNDQFEAIYRIPPVYVDQRKQHIITLRKNTVLANGEPVPSKYVPKVLQKQGNTLVDITNSILPANGSTGVVSVDHYEGKMGPVARLKNVLVKELIEYEGNSGAEYNPGDEFDNADDGSGGVVKVPAKAAKAKVKPKVEDDDELSPF